MEHLLFKLSNNQVLKPAKVQENEKIKFHISSTFHIQRKHSYKENASPCFLPWRNWIFRGQKRASKIKRYLYFPSEVISKREVRTKNEKRKTQTHKSQECRNVCTYVFVFVTFSMIICTFCKSVRLCRHFVKFVS